MVLTVYDDIRKIVGEHFFGLPHVPYIELQPAQLFKANLNLHGQNFSNYFLPEYRTDKIQNQKCIQIQ